MTDMKTCTKCGLSFPASRQYFYGRRRAADGLDCWCKACVLADQRRWRVSARVGGIYSIACRPTGRVYVGSSADVRHRWNCHRSELRNGSHCNVILQRAWDKYGEDSFEFAVLEVVEQEHMLVIIEQAWIDFLHAASESGFNIQPKAGRMKPPEWSKEQRAQLRDQQKARAGSFVLTHPDGVEQVVTNLNDFCKEAGLSASQMRYCARGLTPGYRGYKCRPADVTPQQWMELVNRAQAERQRSHKLHQTRYILTAPDGSESVFTNASAQARGIGVAVGSIHSLINHRALRIKGYAIRREGETQAEADAKTGRGKSSSRARTYWLHYPDGRVEAFDNASQKAREIGVSVSTIHSLIAGRLYHAKGHKLTFPLGARATSARTLQSCAATPGQAGC